MGILFGGDSSSSWCGLLPSDRAGGRLQARRRLGIPGTFGMTAARSPDAALTAASATLTRALPLSASAVAVAAAVTTSGGGPWPWTWP